MYRFSHMVRFFHRHCLHRKWLPLGIFQFPSNVILRQPQLRDGPHPISWRRYARFFRTSSRTLIPAQDAETSSPVQQAGHSVHRTRNRVFAPKTSLRLAAMEAQKHQNKNSSRHVSPPERALEGKVLQRRLSKGNVILTVLQSVTAYCVAEQYDLNRVAEILRDYGCKIDPYSTNLFPQVIHVEMPVISGTPSLNTGEKAQVHTGDVFVFPSGTLVAWSIPDESLISLATKTLFTATINPHLERLETENLEYIEDVNKESSSMRGDTICLGTKNSNAESQPNLPIYRTENDETRSSSRQEPSSNVNTILAKIAFSFGLA